MFRVQHNVKINLFSPGPDDHRTACTSGVTSFNIDFAAKKVTVVGDVTPLGVLNSVSKVKNAQFWAAPAPAATAIAV